MEKPLHPNTLLIIPTQDTAVKLIRYEQVFQHCGMDVEGVMASAITTYLGEYIQYLVASRERLLSTLFTKERFSFDLSYIQEMTEGIVGEMEANDGSELDDPARQTLVNDLTEIFFGLYTTLDDTLYQFTVRWVETHENLFNLVFYRLVGGDSVLAIEEILG